jgi:hypothetical protein
MFLSTEPRKPNPTPICALCNGVYDCPHLVAARKTHDNFIDNAHGYTRLRFDDFDVYGNWRTISYQRSVPKPAIRLLQKKVKQVLETKKINEEDFDAVIAENISFFSNEDSEVRKACAEITSFYLKKRKLTFTNRNCGYLHLILADSDDEPCIATLSALKFILKRFQSLNIEQFTSWFIRYVDSFGNPCLGTDSDSFFVLHPELFGPISALCNDDYPLVDDLIAALQKFPDTKKVPFRIESKVFNDPALLNRKLQVEGLRKKIRGINIQLEGLKAGLSRARNDEHNNLTVVLLENEIERSENNLLEKKRFLGHLLEPTFAYPSMDMETKGEIPSETEQSTNTAIATTDIEVPTVIIASPPDTSYVDEIISDVTHVYPTLTDRMVLFDTLTLDTTITKGTIIKQYHLPYDFVAAKWATPNMLPFRSHEFFTGSVTIQLQCNINKFNQFYLRTGVVYHYLQRDRREELVNPWCISQQPGGRINGHLANSDKTTIVFASYVPTIPILPNSQMLNLYYATISIIAMTDFEVSTGGIDTANLNVYAKFEPDLKFYGQKEINDTPPTFTIPQQPDESEPLTTFATPSMLATAGLLAAGRLLRGGSSETPKSTEPANALLSTLVGVANRLISGSVATATKKLNSETESLLSQLFAALGSNRDKPTNHRNNALHQRAITNLACGSGLYEADSFRLQEVGSTPHPPWLMGVEKYDTIKALIETEGFVNSVTVNNTDTQGTLICSLSTQPGDTNPMYFGGNFPTGIANWTPVDHIAGWFNNYHGKIRFRFECVADGFKTCRLRCVYAPNVRSITYEQSNSFYYETFDLGSSLDTQQTFDFVTPYINPEANFQTHSSSGVPYFAGSVHLFLEVEINAPVNVYPSFDILVFKRAEPETMLFSVPRPNVSLIKLDSSLLPDLPDSTPPVTVPPTAYPFTFFTSDYSVSDPNWSVQLDWSTDFGVEATRLVTNLAPTAPFELTGSTRIRSVNNPSLVWTNNALMTRTFIVNVIASSTLPSTVSLEFVFDTGSEFLTLGPTQVNQETNIRWALQVYTTLPVVTVLPAVAHPSMDIREAMTAAPDLAGPISLIGPALHGESHMHLYENLRRHEHYHSLTTNVDESDFPIRIFSIPLNFGAPLFRENLNEIERSNKILHLHDAMRFTRSSLRHLYTITGDRGGVIRVVHRPQADSYPFSVDAQTTQQQYMDTGYGETIISLQQNNVAAHEFPMYLPTVAVLNASYLSDEILTNVSQGLGVVDFYWQGPASKVTINILRALGDDGQMIMFNGFPIRASRYELPPLDFYPPVILQKTRATPCMGLFSKDLDKELRDAAKNVASLTSTLEDFLRQMFDNGGPEVLLGTLITQIAHVVANPTLTTFGISVAQILVSFRFISIKFLAPVTAALRSAYYWLLEKVRPTANIDDDIDEVASLSSVLISACCSMFGAKTSTASSFTDRIHIMFTTGGGMHMRTLEFIKAILQFCKRCVIFVCSKIAPSSAILEYLDDKSFDTWMTRVNILTDATILSRLKKNRKAGRIINICVKQGETLVLKLSRTKKSTLLGTVSQALTRLRSVRDKLGLVAHVSAVKFDPFCFYIAGKGTQIGKSHMLRELCEEIMKQNNIEPINRTDPMYIVPESDKFWNGYEGQNVIIFDDFMRITPTEASDSDCARLCSAKGAATWEVPKAFETKGMVSEAKIVACASNFAYPKFNGIGKELVWSRRNIVFEVTVDFTVYQNCSDCALFSFGCPLCVEMNKGKFADRKHLSFQQIDPVQEMRKIGNLVDYPTMKAKILRCASVFLKQENEKFEQTIMEMKTYTQDPRFCAIMTPESTIEAFNNVLTDEEFTEAIGEENIPNSAHPSAFWKNLGTFFHLNKETEQITPPSCFHEHFYSELIEPTYNPTGYYWQHYDNGTDETYYLSEEPCCAYCNWIAIEKSFFSNLVEKYKSKEVELPEDFPLRFRPIEQFTRECDQFREQASRESWFGKHSDLLSAIGIGLSVVAAVYTLKRLFYDKKSEPEAPEQQIPTNMDEAHPALMTSGDIKTRFRARLKQPRLTRPFRGLKVAHPSLDTEYDSLIKTFEESILELTTRENNLIVRSVSVNSQFYVTQLHAFATLIAQLSAKILGDYQSGVFCDGECIDRNGTTEHSEICKEKIGIRHPVVLKKTCRGGQALEKEISLSSFFEMNKHTFGVDAGGSDLVSFTLDIGDFTTNNILRYVISETNNHMNSDNFIIYDPHRIGEQGEVYPAENVQLSMEHLTYDNNDVRLWAPGHKNVSVLVNGYKCTNPNPTGMKTACGSVLIDKTTCRIVGVMSACNGTYAYFNALSSEMIRDSFGWHTDHIKDAHGKLVKLSEKDSKRINIPVELETNGRATSSMNIHHATKTTIQKSKCFGVFGPAKRIPANLSQNGDQGQMAIRNGLKNYVPHIPFPRKDIELAIDDVTIMFNNNCKPTIEFQSKRSLQEAVTGIPGYVPRITMSTGPGFPWCCSSDKKRKSDLLFFDDNDMLTQVDAEFYDQLRDEEEKMRKGVKPFTVFQISLKDERLPIEKVNNVRLIQGSSLTLTLSSRRYLMDFNFAFQENRCKLEHCVGINPFSLDWDVLATELVQFSPFICVGDYSKFGPRLLNNFVTGAYEIMHDWYRQFNPPEEDQMVRLMLGERVVNSLNMCYDQIIQLHCGSPSGAMNTVIVNSLCNMLYIRCAWIGIMRKAKPTVSGLHHFKQYVNFYCYGDDVIFAVKPEMIDLFNNQTISEYFAGYGVKYTDVTKGEQMRKFCSIEEASFLKCGFKFFTETTIAPGVWLPQPDLGDLFDTTNWVRKPKGTNSGSDVESILIDAAVSNCEDAVRKSWFHGRKTYEAFQHNVQNYWRNAQGVQRYPTYYTYEGLAEEYSIPLRLQNEVKVGVTPSDLSEMINKRHKANPHEGRCSRKCSHNQKNGVLKYCEEATERDLSLLRENKNFLERSGIVLGYDFDQAQKIGIRQAKARGVGSNPTINLIEPKLAGADVVLK